MKKFKVSGLVMAMGLIISSIAPAHAISESYRRQLEHSGCTQVTDSNGTCDIHKSRGQNMAASEQQAREMASDDDQSPQEAVASKLEQHVVGKYQGEAVDVMQRLGWKRKSEDGLQWSKGGFHAALDMNESTSQVMGVVVR
ncbi:MAG: hypothetical protein ACRDD5_08755 [Silvania sp.]|uniref:hypothetical protein n=1 Tax=Silvania sp. TaxID=3016633 RepID=UPI003EE78BA2